MRKTFASHDTGIPWAGIRALTREARRYAQNHFPVPTTKHVHSDTAAVALDDAESTKPVHSDVAMHKTETTKPVHSDGVAMRKTKTTKAVHSDVVAPSTPARVVKEEPMGRETPASARGVLVCSFSSAEERIVYSKNFLFDDSESLEDKQRLRVACLQDADRLFGQTSSEPAQLLMIAATANRIPFVGLRLWHFEDQVLQTYIRQLIKHRETYVEELAFAQQHKTGWKFVKPTTDYLYNDIGELTASIEPRSCGSDIVVSRCIGGCRYAQSPGVSCYAQSAVSRR
jgi:hypothetical protein